MRGERRHLNYLVPIDPSVLHYLLFILHSYVIVNIYVVYNKFNINGHLARINLDTCNQFQLSKFIHRLEWNNRCHTIVPKSIKRNPFLCANAISANGSISTGTSAYIIHKNGDYECCVYWLVHHLLVSCRTPFQSNGASQFSFSM